MEECLTGDEFCRVASDAVLASQPRLIDVAFLRKGSFVVDKNARHKWKGCEKNACCIVSDLSFCQDL